MGLSGALGLFLASRAVMSYDSLLALEQAPGVLHQMPVPQSVNQEYLRELEGFVARYRLDQPSFQTHRNLEEIQQNYDYMNNVRNRTSEVRQGLFRDVHQSEQLLRSGIPYTSGMSLLCFGIFGTLAIKRKNK